MFRKTPGQAGRRVGSLASVCMANFAPKRHVTHRRPACGEGQTTMERLRFPISLVLATLLVACASGASGGGRGARNVLTYDELVATNETNLYRAIQRLRPQWLRPRGQTSVTAATVVTVFVDGSPRGDASELIGMPLTGIVDVTHLSASEAAFRFGTVAGSGGTLEISTRR